MSSTLEVNVETGVLRHRQRVHVAAQQDRRAGLAAGQHGGDAAGGLVQREVERQALDRLEHVVARDRQVVADLGPLVQRAAQLDGRPEQVVGRFAE